VVRTAAGGRDDVFNFKREIEDYLRRATVLAPVPGTFRNRWVELVHEPLPLRSAAARRAAARNSASTRAASSACSSAAKLVFASRAARRRCKSSVSRRCWDSVKNWSGRNDWTTRRALDV